MMPDPMALPAPPALMIFLFGLTWVLHIGFLGLLVATLWAKAGAEWGRQSIYDPERLHRAAVVGFSMAITAGVAPLLFVQVLYPKYFYSSSIAIGFPWLAIVGYLLVAFYALYLSRWRWDRAAGPSRSGKGLLILAMLMILAIGFTYSWNHLRSLAATPWTHQVPHAHAALRLLGYGGAVFMAAGAWASWFGRMWRRDGSTPSGTKWSLLIGAVSLLVWMLISDFAVKAWGAHVFMLVGVIAGAVAGLWHWVRPGRIARWFVLVAAPTAILGLFLQRESYRLETLATDYNPAAHGIRMQWGPFIMFAVSLVIAVGVLVWLLVLIRRPARSGPATL